MQHCHFTRTCQGCQIPQRLALQLRHRWPACVARRASRVVTAAAAVEESRPHLHKSAVGDGNCPAAEVAPASQGPVDVISNDVLAEPAAPPGHTAGSQLGMNAVASVVSEPGLTDNASAVDAAESAGLAGEANAAVEQQPADDGIIATTTSFDEMLELTEELHAGLPSLATVSSSEEEDSEVQQGQRQQQDGLAHAEEQQQKQQLTSVDSDVWQRQAISEQQQEEGEPGQGLQAPANPQHGSAAHSHTADAAVGAGLEIDVQSEDESEGTWQQPASAADGDYDDDDITNSTDSSADDSATRTGQQQQQQQGRQGLAAPAGEAVIEKEGSITAGSAKVAGFEKPSTNKHTEQPAEADTGEDTKTSSDYALQPVNERHMHELKSVIAPVLKRFGLEAIVPALEKHIESGKELKRGSVTLARICAYVLSLCDSTLATHYAQGLLTCYVGAAWVLRASQLTIRAKRPAVDVTARPDATMHMSVAGDLLSLYRDIITTKKGCRTGSFSIRQYLESCPWMMLTPPASNASDNRVTVNLFQLAYCASPKRLTEFIIALKAAVLEKMAGSSGHTAQRTTTIKAAAIAAAGRRDAALPVQHKQSLLVAAAVQAVKVGMVAAIPARHGGLRRILQTGVVVKLNVLAVSMLRREDLQDAETLTPGIISALHEVLQEAKPYWRCIKQDASIGSSVWRFDLPALVQQDPALTECAAKPFGFVAPASAEAAAAAVISSSTAAGQGVLNITDVAATQQPASEPPAASNVQLPGHLVANSRTAAAGETTPAFSSSPATPSTSIGNNSKGAAAYAASLYSSTPVSAANRAAAGAAARLSALFGPHGAKVGPSLGLEYTQQLPGLGPVRVVTVTSADSPAYSSMLQHMASVRLIGMDSEASWLASERIVVVIAFMVPAAPGTGSDQGWPDTVYIIDLVAAGRLQQNKHRAQQQAEVAATAAASNLLAGLSSVFRDPSCSVIVQDASQDLPKLQSEFGLTFSSVIDTQLCFMMVGAVQQQQGLRVPGKLMRRKRLEVLLNAYGLQHPNKMDMVARSKSNPMLWLTAARPLPADLLSYVVGDVRYLPALVLLMERDLLQAAPGTLVREVQPYLPRDLQPPITINHEPFSNTLVLPSAAQQQQGHIIGLPKAVDAASAAGTGRTNGSSNGLGGSSDSDNGSSNSSSWIEPAANDTLISNLVFLVQRAWLCSKSLQHLHQLVINGPQPQYKLLVPPGAVQQATQAAAAAVGSSACNGSWQQQLSDDIITTVGVNTNSSSSWKPDAATQSLLGLLPPGLAGLLTREVSAKARLFQTNQAKWLKHVASSTGLSYDTSNLPMPQLQQLRIVPGSYVTYKIGISGIAAAAIARHAMLEVDHQFSLPRNLAAVKGLMDENGCCSWQLIQQCLSIMLQKQPGADVAPAIGSKGSAGCSCEIKAGHHSILKADVQAAAQQVFNESDSHQPHGTLHSVSPIWVPCSSNLNSSAAQLNSASTKQLGGLLYTVGRPQPALSHVVRDVLQQVAYQAELAGPLRGYPTSDTVPQQVQQVFVFQQHSTSWQPQTSDLSAWRLGLEPVAQLAVGPGSHSKAQPGCFMLLLGVRQSGKASLLRDIVETFSTGRRPIAAAVVDMCSSVAGVDVTQERRCIGAALHLPVNDAATQAAAVAAAWQLHRCQVIILDQLISHGSEVLAAVQEALAAGVSVLAAADGFADLAALHAAATGVPNVAAAALASAAGAPQQQQPDQQQQASAALWELLCRFSSEEGHHVCSSCTVVECIPGYRWLLHTQLAGSLLVLQQQAEAAAMRAETALSPVQPVQVRQFVPVGLHGLPALAAAVVTGSGQFTQITTSTETSAAGSSGKQRSTTESRSEAEAGSEGGDSKSSKGIAVVAQFASYGAAVGQLPPPLLTVVRQLLYQPVR